MRSPTAPEPPPPSTASVASVAFKAWFAPVEVEVRPGHEVTLVLTIENLGDRTENLNVVPSGISAPWVSVSRASLTLFGGSQDAVEVTVRPPAMPTTTAGNTPLTVRVAPLRGDDDGVIAEATLRIGAFDDRRISLLQPMRRARRRAIYELMVENHGNQLASCRLHLVDPSNRVDGVFDPPAVGVPPGASSLVRLRLHATSVTFRRQDRQLEFEIEATQTDHDPAVARATLVQPPTVPSWAVPSLVVAMIVAMVAALAWFGVVRPEIRDAAERAVDARLSELMTAGDTDEDDPSDLPGPPGSSGIPGDGEADAPARPASTEGEPYSVRLALRVAAGGTNSDGARVPDGVRLLLTDIVLQNPNADLGSAALLRDGSVLYEWDLGAMTNANEFQPRLTPLPVEPGSELVFRTTCTGPGSSTATGCEVAVLLAGRLVPAVTDTDDG